jgi:putative ABC transport system permease protein
MTAVVAAMLRARRTPAVLVLLLSALAAAAAVAGPVYTAATDRASVATEVELATRTEKTVMITAPVESREVSVFDSAASSLRKLPGFTLVHGVEFPVLGLDPDPTNPTRMVFRADICPHLTVTSGRCLMADDELIVGESTAERLHVRAGQTVTVRFAVYNDAARRWDAAGRPATVGIVGVYRPRDVAEPYWGRSGFFAPGVEDAVSEPVFMSRPTVDTIEHESDQRSAEAIPRAGSISAATLPALAEAVSALTDDVEGGAGGIGAAVLYDDDLPDLLGRVDRARTLTRQLVPIAALPLLGLCWLVLFLAVAYGSEARRHEQALFALRGGSRATRLWLATGESLAAIVVGAPVGYVAGTIVVGLVADARYGAGFTLAPAPGAALAACVAVAGAIVAGLFGLRRLLSTPVVDLLRRIPPPASPWRSVAVEACVVVLAVIAAVQLRAFDGSLVGLGQLVPGLVVLGVAVVAARLLVPVAARVGGAAIRRGKLGLALGALQIARRPGSQRLFVLLAVAVALLGFAVTAVDVAAQARAARAQVETGADRTVSVVDADAGELLRTVRAVDPAGAFAMATATTTSSRGPRTLFADLRAMPAVIGWRPEYGPYPAADIAGRLRPPTGEPVVLSDSSVALTVDYPVAQPRTTVELSVVLRPLAGGSAVRAGTGPLRAGTATYVAPADGCEKGCRVAAIRAGFAASGNATTDVTLVSLASARSKAVAVDAGGFGGWQVSAGGTGRPGPAGLVVSLKGAGLDPRPIWVTPGDTLQTLPVLSAGMPADLAAVDNVDGSAMAVHAVASATSLPRLGKGVLADLEYGERAATGNTLLLEAQVWLGPKAPADAVDRLVKAGLVISGQDSSAAAARRLDHRGPALAMWFQLLAGAGATALAATGMALMAAVDRRRTLDDLVALRRQGLGGPTAARGVLWAYLSVAVAAVVTGAAAAATAWWVAGRYLPLFLDDDFALAPPVAPRPLAVLGPAVLVIVLFAVVAVALRRAFRVRD